MKIPKKIKMFGYDWKVILYEGEPDSFFNWDKFIIRISKKYAEEELIHEMSEAILVHLQFRYRGIEGGMEYKFIFDHTGLCQFHKILYQTFKDNKLI